MTKPWEEEWDRDSLAFVGHSGMGDARRRLASAAPDMARALLAVEWSVYDAAGCPVVCPSCFGRRDLNGHVRTCALDAALRKAGVR